MKERTKENLPLQEGDYDSNMDTAFLDNDGTYSRRMGLEGKEWSAKKTIAPSFSSFRLEILEGKINQGASYTSFASCVESP